MSLLKDILYKVPITQVLGSTETKVNAIVIDSRKITQGNMFVAVPGTQVDGHDFINSAIEKGAQVIVVERLPNQPSADVVFVVVKNASLSLAQMAVNLYNSPASSLKLVAVTGTNGKTSIATLLWKLYTKLGFKTGLLSTVENKIGENIIPATHTTPDAVALNDLLAQMVAEGCDYCFMEASSHAIHQNRTYALDFKGAIFTNLTHDHLDYHNSFKEYLNAKKALFDQLPSSAFALTNADDKNGAIMLQNTKARKFTYGLRSMSDYTAKILESDFLGMNLLVDGVETHTTLIGDFNAYNFLAVYAAAQLLGTDKMEVLAALSTIKGAEGRFDYIVSPKDKIIAIVDYAHTPDALKNVLETIRGVKKPTEQLFTVVGCGGDRDKSKRPLMAAIACKMSDTAILTSDNPRTEDPATILNEMKEGVAVVDKKKMMVIQQRDEAIRTAVRMAQPKDIVLVAGKGHEKYQDIKGVKHPFDDKEHLKAAFKELER